MGIRGIRQPAVRIVGWVVAAAALAGGAYYYSTGRPAGELHATAQAEAKVTPTIATPTRTTTVTISPSPTDEPVLTSGPGIDEPGVAVIARMADPSTLDVSESIRLSTPVRSLTITPPDPAGELDPEDPRPVLEEVQVSVDGQPVPLISPTVAEQVTLTFGAATEIDVRYLQRDSVIRSVPSTAGRGLAPVRPVADVGQATLPVAFALHGAEVVGLGCPTLPKEDYACATGEQGRLGVAKPLPWRDATVTLQLDLPRS